MTDVEAARKQILSTAKSCGIENVAIDQALGRVLAVTVTTDRDLPPFDRVTMDGIAVSSADWAAGQRFFKRVAQQFAGEPQCHRGTETGTCVETSTGAVLPGDCDAILPYEWLRETDAGFECVHDGAVKPYMNVHRKGSDLPQGYFVLHAGYRIDPTAIGILASVGCTEVSVRTLPRIAVISTGDELVDINNSPLSHQVRRSNDRAISAVLADLGVTTERFHLEDSPQSMAAWLANNRQRFDALVFSGGVSKGKRDFLPQVLEQSGIRQRFHRVSQRPGKPFWFGEGTQVVFGLPGNPVSALVGAVVYIRPWVEACLGLIHPQQPSPPWSVILAEELQFQPPLTLFKPVVIECVQGQLLARPAEYNGSGDFSSLAGIHGFIELDQSSTHFPAGSVVNYHPIAWKRN